MRYFSNKRVILALLAFATVFFTFIVGSVQYSNAAADILEKYKKGAAKFGVQLGYGKVETLDSGDFKVTDVLLTQEGLEDTGKIGSITIRGIKQLKGYGLSADHIAFSDFSWKAKDEKGKITVVTVDTGEYSGLYIPDESDLEAPLFNYGNTQFKFYQVKVKNDDTPTMIFPSMIGGSTYNEEEKLLTAFFNMNDMDSNIETIDDEKVRENMAAMGVKKFKMDMDMEATWNTETGRMDLRKFEIGAQNMGSLIFQMAFGGYTEKVGIKLRNANYEVAKLPLEERGKAYEKSLEEMSNLTFESAKIIFNDKSATGNLLEMQAKSNDKSVDEIKTMIPIMVSNAVGRLLPEEVLVKVQGALKSFLDNPGTFTISAMPASPMKFGDIFSAATSLPEFLIMRLNIDATASN